MTPHLQALMARKLAAEAERSAAEARLKEAQIAAADAGHELAAAQEWLAIPKAARKRARAADPADVAAFAAARSYGDNEPRWREAGWRKQRIDRSGWRTEYYNEDTPTGTAARILHRRGVVWCDQLETPCSLKSSVSTPSPTASCGATMPATASAAATIATATAIMAT